MDFTYTSRMAELKARAAELAGKIMVFEDECEMDNGLSPESHAAIKAAVLEAGLNAINQSDVTITSFSGHTFLNVA